MKARYGYIFLWLSAIPAAILRFHNDAAGLWCAHALPRIRALQAFVSSAFPFPLCDLLLILLITAAAACILPKWRRFLPYMAGLIALSLSLTWSAPCALSEEPAEAGSEQLHLLCRQLSAQAGQIQAQNRIFDRKNVLRDAAALCKSAVIPKEAAFPALAKAMGIAGWWSPLTAEAVVDGTLGEINLPFTACHELMHARGVASESQANYLAYLACMQGDGAFRYSGTMNALWYAMRSLRTVDPAAWQEVISQMDERVYADFRRMNGLDEAPHGALETAQDALTGLYLRLSGADSYDGFASWLVYSANSAK